MKYIIFFILFSFAAFGQDQRVCVNGVPARLLNLSYITGTNDTIQADTLTFKLVYHEPLNEVISYYGYLIEHCIDNTYTIHLPYPTDLVSYNRLENGIENVEIAGRYKLKIEVGKCWRQNPTIYRFIDSIKPK